MFLIHIIKFSYQCHYTCKSCSPFTNDNISCLDCQNNKHRQLHTTSCYCLQGYYDDGNNQLCVACSYNCKGCRGGSTSECANCQLTYHRLNDTDCTCTTGFYDDGSTPLCQPCNFKCYDCTTNSNNCISCDPSMLRKLISNTCDCIQNYYSTNVTLCQKCDRTCLICTVSSTQCTSCNSSDYRTLSGNSCPCNIGYYDDPPNRKCPACHYSCKDCTNGSSANECDNCNSSNHRTLNINICQPNTHYYDSGLSTAQQCHFTCLNCTAGGASGCSFCNSSQFRSISNNSCPCNTGYFDNNTEICVLCHYSCLTCHGHVDNNCISCDNTRDLSNQFCRCLGSTYDNGSNCQPCTNNCLTCISANYCLTCNTTNNFQLNTIYCHCIDHYYLFGGNTCNICSTKCNTCITSSTSCSSCLLNQFRYLSSFSCLCKVGYFQSNGLDICQICAYSCLTCIINSTNCQSCNATEHRVLTSNSCDCDKLFYDKGIVGLCQACYSSCLTCNGSLYNNCTSCPPNKQLISGQCSCKNGTFLSTGSKCLSCHPTCTTCQNANNDACTNCPTNYTKSALVIGRCQCNPGYFIDLNFYCQQCISRCATCNFQSVKCTSCLPGVNLVGDDCFCINGQFMTKIGICSSCSTKCQTCNGTSTQCLTCHTSQFRTKSQNDCVCLVTYYDSAVDICSTCPVICYSCISAGCLSCGIYSNRDLFGYNCTCRSAYYDSGTACIPCDITCLTCFGSTSNECSSCQIIERNKVGTQCLCLVGTYSNGNACLNCHPNCLVCSGDSNTQCSSCISNAQLISTSCIILLDCGDQVYHLGICKPQCPQGYYNKSGYCAGCLEVCLQCDQLGCKRCKSGYYIQDITCVNQCSSKYFLNNITCVSCPSHCQSCALIQNITVCSKCDPGYSYHQYLCVSPCPTKYFQNSNYICIGCQPICQTCYGALSTQCLSCLSSYVLTPINSCEYCQSQAFSKDGKCLPCNHPCNTCQKTLCLSCVEGYYLDKQKCLEFGTFINAIEQIVNCENDCYHCKGPLGICQICKQNRGDWNLNPVNGICKCRLPYVQNYKSQCQKIYSLQLLHKVVIGCSASLSISMVLINLAKGHYLSSLRVIDAFQIISLLGLLETQGKYGLQQTLNSLSLIGIASPPSRVLQNNLNKDNVYIIFIIISGGVWILGLFFLILKKLSIKKGLTFNTRTLYYISEASFFFLIYRLPFLIIYVSSVLIFRTITFSRQGTDIVLAAIVGLYIFVFLIWIMIRLGFESKSFYQMDSKLLFIVTQLDANKIRRINCFLLPCQLIIKIGMTISFVVIKQIKGNRQAGIIMSSGCLLLILINVLGPLKLKMKVISVLSYLVILFQSILFILLEIIANNEIKLYLVYVVDYLIIAYSFIIILLMAGQLIRSIIKKCQSCSNCFQQKVNQSIDDRILYQRQRNHIIHQQSYQDLQQHWQRVIK